MVYGTNVNKVILFLRHVTPKILSGPYVHSISTETKESEYVNMGFTVHLVIFHDFFWSLHTMCQ